MFAYTLRMAAGLLAGLSLLAAPVHAQDAVEQFYKGRQLSLLASAGPGSGYTIWAHFIGEHIGRFIPGRPTVVVGAKPGAGGLIAANYLYTLARKDGTEIATLAREAPALALMGGPGVEYDALKFNWLGSPTIESNLCVVGKDTPIKSVDDLFTKETIVGSDGVGSGMHIFPAALNAILNTKFKPISAYSDSGVVMLALDRGEITGVCQSAGTLMERKAKEIKDGTLRVVLQGGLKPNPRFPGVPFVLDLAKNPERRQLLAFIYSGLTFGRPYAAPPGVPAERVAALRKAFMDMLKDPEFLAAAEKRGYEVDPISGEEMTSLIVDLAKTPKDVVARANEIMHPKK